LLFSAQALMEIEQGLKVVGYNRRGLGVGHDHRICG
jgi:hypothetical protein